MISNACDVANKEEREELYLAIIKKYTKQEIDFLTNEFSKLILLMQECVDKGILKDILGTIFMNLGLGTELNGQVFTPEGYCDFIAWLLFDCEKEIKEKGFITILEPCSGSGRLILHYAQLMRENSHNYNKQLFVTAIDNSDICVAMSYVQLSLYGIPAVVINGNFLTLKEVTRWYTPVYIMNGWFLKTASLSKVF